ncbi:tyrosine-protein kinase RYK-like [Sycon ciliatum]|uniref:tyrosine-protein kinase RYK-like n=1 Tax=Sycon ciliatum TaxID=27933 RepID=UPI0031F61927
MLLRRLLMHRARLREEHASCWSLLLSAIVLCALASVRETAAFDLRVNPTFQAQNFGEAKGEVQFIQNGSETPTLFAINNGFASFAARYTHNVMDWRVYEGELVTYSMMLWSENYSIMGQPSPDIPLSGNLTNTNYTTFRTEMPCLNVDGTTYIVVNLLYQVYELNDITDEYELWISDGNATLRIRRVCKMKEVEATPPPDGEDSFPLNLVIGCSIGGLVLILLVILMLVTCYYKRYNRRLKRLRDQTAAQELMNENSQYEGGRVPGTGYSGYTRTEGSGLMPLEQEEVTRVMVKLRQEWTETLDGFLLPRDIISYGKEIGRGAFGRVLKGSIVYGDAEREVAIKTLKSVSAQSDLYEFLEEAVVMKEFDHPNVVALMGVCIEGDQPPMVCLEMMHNGDLRSYLRRSRGLEPQHGPVGEMSVAQLLEFCAMILDGMTYLSAQNFVHRDLATRNCMLNKDLIVKIGDFGLARDIHGEVYYVMGTPRRLPVKWMAFESLQDQVFNSMTDVWSFGVVMWEIFSLGQSPYPGVDNSEMIEYLISGRRMAMPPKCPDDFYNLMLACWTIDKKHRPTFKQLVPMLADYRDVFYENVEVKENDPIVFARMHLSGQSQYAQRHSSMFSTTGSITTVQTEVTYAPDNATQYSSSGYGSVGSVGYYAKANRPSDDFRKRVISKAADNPHYSPVGGGIQETECYNPNYHPTEVAANTRTPANGTTTSVRYPMVTHSSTPANASISNSSPPRGQPDLPSPVLEEGWSGSRSPPVGDVGRWRDGVETLPGSSMSPTRNATTGSSARRPSINEQRRARVEETDL